MWFVGGKEKQAAVMSMQTEGHRQIIAILRKHINKLLFMAIFIFLLIFFLFCSHYKEYNLQKYWPYRGGSVWCYQVVKTKLPSASHMFEKNFKVEDVIDFSGRRAENFIYDDGNKVLYTTYDGGVRLFKEIDEDGGYAVYSPEVIEIPLRMRIGETICQPYAYTEYYRNGEVEDRGRGTAKVALLKEENIRVGEKVFKHCLKFLHISRWEETTGDYGTTMRIFWLAPHAGKVKEIEVFIEYDKDNRRSKHIIRRELQERRSVQ